LLFKLLLLLQIHCPALENGLIMQLLYSHQRNVPPPFCWSVDRYIAIKDF